MPLEIRELIIKVTVEEANAPAAANEKELYDMKRAIIKECIEEVLIKLEKNAER